MTCGRKCFRKGRITSNGYLNFLRMYRQKCCGLSPTETVRRGAKAWNRLNCEQKKRYKRMGCKKRRKKKKRCPRPRKRKCAVKRRRKPSCKKKRRRPKRKSGCRRRKKRCMRPGPVTSNGYLNFLRWYRKKHCGLKPNEAIRKGARKWCSMSDCKKERFRRMACKVATGKKSKRSAICRRC